MDIDIGSILNGINYLIPEIILASTLVLLILQDLIKPGYGWSLIIFMAGVLLSIFFVKEVPIDDPIWQGLIKSDQIGNVAKWITGASGILTAVMGLQKSSTVQKPGEYFTFLTTIILGAYLAVSSTNLLIIMIALELISIPSYVLTAFYFNKKGSEGALKYFLFGAASSAIFIYGISFYYGFTGNILLGSIDIPGEVITGLNGAIILILAGILFKVAAVPMHVWLPDVYESAPTPVVAFFSVVPKVAGLVLLTRIAFWHSNLFGDQLMLLILSLVAVASMFVGNLGALRQNNAKRMLGYSTIAHSGFLILAIISLDGNGIVNLFFYLGVYMIMSFGAFALIDHVEKSYGITAINDMTGLGKVLPLVGVLFIIHLISLTGLPPTAGFLAKFLVFAGVWESWSLSGNGIFLALLVIAILNTVIALFYYIRIPFSMFLNDPVTDKNFTSSINVYLSAILAIMILILFFMPGLLIEVFNNVNFVL